MKRVITTVGGDVAGWAATLAIARKKAATKLQLVEIPDKSGFCFNGHGSGVAIGPNGLRALRYIGGDSLMRKVMDAGGILRGTTILKLGELSPPSVMLHRPSGAVAATGLPDMMIRTSTLLKIIRQELETCPNIEFTHSLLPSLPRGYEARQDGSLQLLMDGYSEASLLDPCHLLVAADGIHSTFRALLRKGQTTIQDDALRRADVLVRPRSSLKAVVQADLSAESEEFLREEGHAFAYFHPRAIFMAGPVAKGYTYWSVSLSDGTDRKPNRTGLPDAQPTDVADNTKDLLLARLKSKNGQQWDVPSFIVRLIEATPQSDIIGAWSEVTEPMAPSFISSDETVVLLGDAAHAVSPEFGQGVNLALEEAAALSQSLASSSSLQTYDIERRIRRSELSRLSARRLQDKSSEQEAESFIYSWDIAD